GRRLGRRDLLLSPRLKPSMERRPVRELGARRGDGSRVTVTQRRRPGAPVRAMPLGERTPEREVSQLVGSTGLANGTDLVGATGLTDGTGCSGHGRAREQQLQRRELGG